MDDADWYGEPFRRLLRSAERRREAANAFGLLSRKTAGSRSNAWLVSVTCCDHFLLRPLAAVRPLRFPARARCVLPRC
jgi:hypothetical protein